MCIPLKAAGRKLAAFAFWAALAATLFFALLPPERAISPTLWDKADHFLAFAVLTFTALSAQARARPRLTAVALLALAGGIELLQGPPFARRTPELADLAPAALAVAAVIAAHAAWGRRARGDRGGRWD
jgi:hypothetical protein